MSEGQKFLNQTTPEDRAELKRYLEARRMGTSRPQAIAYGVLMDANWAMRLLHSVQGFIPEKAEQAVTIRRFLAERYPREV